MNSDNRNQKLIFRELNSENELIEHYRLRYKIYLNSRLAGFILPNKEQLDIDEYDAHSKHFGLFLVDGNREKQIGGLRVVESLSKDNTSEINYSSIKLLNYSTASEHVVEYLINSRCKSNEIVEVSRLILSEKYRSLATITKLVNSIIIYCGFSNYAYKQILISCKTIHKAFYTRYGFYQVPGTSDKYWEKPGAVGSVMIASPDDVPEKYAGKFRKLAEFYNQNGYLEYAVNRKTFTHQTVRCNLKNSSVSIRAEV